MALRRITNYSYEPLGHWDYRDNIHIPAPVLQGPSVEISLHMSIAAFLGLQVGTIPLLNGTLKQGTSGGVEGGLQPTSVITHVTQDVRYYEHDRAHQKMADMFLLQRECPTICESSRCPNFQERRCAMLPIVST